MGALRTIIGAVFASLCLATPGFCFSLSPQDRLQVFAVCAGRLSALEEQQRMFDGPASERTAAQIRDFEALIEALLPFAVQEGLNGRSVLHWRVDAKMAQAMLLQAAVFGTDPNRADMAQQRADSLLVSCKSLLLGA